MQLCQVLIAEQYVLYSYKSSKGGYVIEKMIFRSYHVYIYIQTPNCENGMAKQPFYDLPSIYTHKATNLHR